MTAQYYTIKNTPVKEVALRLADHLLALPTGSWPETREAEEQLAGVLPDGVSLDDMLEFAARHTKHIHSTRMEWLRALGRKYSMADEGKVYPALAK